MLYRFPTYNVSTKHVIINYYEWLQLKLFLCKLTIIFYDFLWNIQHLFKIYIGTTIRITQNFFLKKINKFSILSHSCIHTGVSNHIKSNNLYGLVECK